ncbi:TolC family protein [bacterium]|nr:TolC family protein [bacterium]
MDSHQIIIKTSMRSSVLFFISLVYCTLSFADSLSFDQFLLKVKSDHPIAKQAELQIELGENQVLAKRGGFDPVLQAELREKYYNGTSYYSKSSGGLKIPTWIGLDFEANVQNNEGVYLNPEAFTSDLLYYFGMNLPVGEGLFIDERRAELKKAKLYLEATEASRDLLLNDLMLNAAEAYLSWYRNYKVYLLYLNAYELAKQRFDVVVQSHLLGDLPAIDTVEASIQKDSRLISLQESELKLKNSKRKLELFLWEEGLVPLVLDSLTIPDTSSTGTPLFDREIYEVDSLISAHPELRIKQLAVSRLKVEERWKKEQLKPDLNLKYGVLSPELDYNQLDWNNYMLGLGFEIPVLLRKERGELNTIQLKIQEQELGLAYQRADLYYLSDITLNNRNTILLQIEVYRDVVANYNRLLRGEITRFENGESSLFMINSRELPYIQSQMNYIDLDVEMRLIELQYLHRLGILFKEV